MGVLRIPQMRDVYRDVHERGNTFPVSHMTGGSKPTPHRYDLIFASTDLETRGCEYLSGWLKRDADRWRLSDHAPVEAQLVLRGS